VHGVDCGLDLVRTRPVQLETLSDQRVPFLDLGGVPGRSVLVGQDDEYAVTHARGTPGVQQEHQREQPEHLRLRAELCAGLP
jgi:hypothetical protein